MNKLLKKSKITLVDVGASGGVHKRWKKINGSLFTLLFEPDNRSFLELSKNAKDHNSHVFNYALSDKEGVTKFFLCKVKQKSSCLEPNFDFLKLFHNPDRFSVVDQLECKCNTLDNILSNVSFGPVDFIKLDTQGTELDILRGSEKTLDDVFGVEVEVEFAKLYKNQSLFFDVNHYITNKNFVLMDLSRYHWKRDVYKTGIEKGQLIFSDALYLRTPEYIASSKGLTKEKVFKAIAIYLVYGYIDLAFSLLSKSQVRALIEVIEYHQCRKYILRSRKRVAMPNFKGKGLIYSFLKKITKSFEPKCSSNGCDPTLGN